MDWENELAQGVDWETVLGDWTRRLDWHGILDWERELGDWTGSGLESGLESGLRE